MPPKITDTTNKV